jgi:hypothetical protein
MKRIVIGAALAALLMGGAQAQSYFPSAGSGNLVRNPSLPNSGPVGPDERADSKATITKNSAPNGNDAFAFAPGTSSKTQHHRWHRE